MSIYYNEKASNLDECFKSIFNQTVKPNEIILIKDGPLTSELNAVIKKYKDIKDIDLIIHEFSENKGLALALQKGIELCNFEYIARMDSDDIARNDRFEIQVNNLITEPNVDIIGSHIIEFDDCIENVLSARKVPLNHFDILNYSKKRNPFNHMTVMYKKSAVINSGNYQRLNGPGYEDYDLWIRMITSGYICKNINDYLVYARTGKEMYKRRGDIKRLKTALNFRRKLYKNGYINFLQYFKSYTATLLFILVPQFIRGSIYKLMLRDRIKN